MAEMKGGGGNWRTSIVDLLTLLDLDSSLDARKDLAEEVLKDPKLARDLEHRVFGYFDTLSDMLRQTLAAQAAGNPAPLSAVPSKPAGPPNPA